jgi:hypothetical protein
MLVVIGFDYGDLWKWEDFDPSRLSSLMSSFDAPWWVAGGRALDLWMGHQTRAHLDVDVAILRDGQKQLHESFGGSRDRATRLWFRLTLGLGARANVSQQDRSEDGHA